MKGLKVRKGGQTMEIAVPEGNVSVTVGCHDGKYYINAGGMEVASGKVLRWLDEDGLPAGTTIEVTCCDVPEPAESVSSVDMEADSLKQKLEKYKYALHLIDVLRPELVKAGLIDPTDCKSAGDEK